MSDKISFISYSKAVDTHVVQLNRRFEMIQYNSTAQAKIAIKQGKIGLLSLLLSARRINLAANNHELFFLAVQNDQLNCIKLLMSIAWIPIDIFIDAMTQAAELGESQFFQMCWDPGVRNYYGPLNHETILLKMAEFFCIAVKSNQIAITKLITDHHHIDKLCNLRSLLMITVQRQFNDICNLLLHQRRGLTRNDIISVFSYAVENELFKIIPSLAVDHRLNSIDIETAIEMLLESPSSQAGATIVALTQIKNQKINNEMSLNSRLFSKKFYKKN